MRRPPSLAHHLGRWFIPFGMNQLPGKSRTGQRPTRRPGPHEGPPKREREVRPTDEGPAYGVCIHIAPLLNAFKEVSYGIFRPTKDIVFRVFRPTKDSFIGRKTWQVFRPTTDKPD